MGLANTPKEDGYRMPAEWEPHERCWMLWPYRPDNWRDGAAPARAAFAAVIAAIARFEPVTVCVRPEDRPSALQHLGGIRDVTLLDMDSDDSWMRDVGPTFLVPATDPTTPSAMQPGDDGVPMPAADMANRHATSAFTPTSASASAIQPSATPPLLSPPLAAVAWRFNAWGGLYTPVQDQLVAGRVLDRCGTEAVRRYAPELVMEGGSFHVDGERRDVGYRHGGGDRGGFRQGRV